MPREWFAHLKRKRCRAKILSNNPSKRWCPA